MQRELLLLAHQYFDFSLLRWQEFLSSSPSMEALFLRKHRLAPRALSCSMPKNANEAIAQSKELQRYYERAISFADPDYPQALEKLGNSRPVILYLKGAPIPEEKSLISIVGTRKPSAFGVTNAEAFSHHLSLRGFGIVSGLALGIDGTAHRKALPKYTLAVLGSGLDHIYPSEHKNLAEEILASQGTIVSQFPPLQLPLPINFPRRNALIAALSAGLIVVEGSEKSGANITGKLALELGTTTIVLLQDYRTPGGRGAIQLLELGATAVRNIEEAIHAISLRFGGKLIDANVSFPEQKEFQLLDYMKEKKISLPAAIASIEAAVLGHQLERLPGGYYRPKQRNRIL